VPEVDDGKPQETGHPPPEEVEPPYEGPFMLLGGERDMVKPSPLGSLEHLGQVTLGVLDIHHLTAEFHIRWAQGVAQDIR